MTRRKPKPTAGRASPVAPLEAAGGLATARPTGGGPNQPAGTLVAPAAGFKKRLWLLVVSGLLLALWVIFLVWMAWTEGPPPT